ncbi:MAG: deoxyribose-phosphate aldolase [Tatlockia sp.]|nr:deoxyribose-phosphate aldolase [Tatlockia sp.]
MNLEEDYLIAYFELIATLKTYAPSFQEVIALIDLTLLDESASETDLINLCEKANHHQVAAVCVLANHLQNLNLQPEIRLATVVNFPEGNQKNEDVMAAIDIILTNHRVHEIDYVFPYQAYLEGKQQLAITQCHEVYKLCQQEKIVFKVILETGALPSLNVIYQLSSEILGGGCDFLKTSTGKIIQGATLAAAFAMLKAIKDNNAHCGLKISGGIKTPEQAFSYMALAQQQFGLKPHNSWFRIGASSLLDILVRH